MVPLLEHQTGLPKGRLNCHGPTVCCRSVVSIDFLLSRTIGRDADRYWDAPNGPRTIDR